MMQPKLHLLALYLDMYTSVHVYRSITYIALENFESAALHAKAPRGSLILLCSEIHRSSRMLMNEANVIIIRPSATLGPGPGSRELELKIIYGGAGGVSPLLPPR